MTDSVRWDLNEAVATITLNRPEARNAVNGAVARGIAAAVAEFDGRADVRTGTASQVNRELEDRIGRVR